jgi:hypothetical protein
MLVNISATLKRQGVEEADLWIAHRQHEKKGEQSIRLNLSYKRTP